MRFHFCSYTFKNFLCFYFLAAACNISYSQVYDFISYSSHDGLIQSNVNDIAQDKQGVIWFATDGGISRFDGYDFKNYTTSDGLLQSSVNTICFDGEDNLWIGYKNISNRLSRFNRNKFVHLNFEKYFNSWQLIRSHENELWLTTNGSGLILIQNAGAPDTASIKRIIFSGKDGLSDKTDGIAEDEKGNIWVTAGNSVYTVSKSSYKVSKVEALSKLKVEFTSAAFNRNGELFLGTEKDGLIRYIPSSEQAEKILENSLPDNSQISSLIFDSSGKLWISSWNAGVVQYHHNKTKIFSVDNGLPGNRVHSVFQDDEGNIWFGLREKGVAMLRDEFFITYNKSVGMADDIINSVTLDSFNRIWVGTNNGIDVLADSNGEYKKIKTINLHKAPGCNRIFALKSIGSEYIFAGTFGCGLALINQKNHSVIRTYLSYNDLDYINAADADDENVWLATITGLIKYSLKNNDAHEFSQFQNKNISAVYIDSNKKICVGVKDHGLFIMQGDEFIQDTSDALLQRATIISMCEDGNGTLWLACEGQGIFIKNGNNVEHLTAKNGLPSELVTHLIPDGNNVWIGTNKGISRYDLITKKITNYGELRSGIASFEIKSNAGLKNNKEEIVFGTTSGLAVVNSSSLTGLKPAAPRLFLLSAKETFDNILEKNNIKLSSNQNNLSFEFVALNYSNPLSVRYQYILEGHDKQWQLPSVSKFVSYSDLSPGSYSFKVRTTTGNITWDNAESFSFIILPPVWKRWWFNPLLILFVSGIVFVFYKSRVRTIKRKEKEKTEIHKGFARLEMKALRAQVNPHFIFNSLQSIQTFILQNKTEDANTYLIKFTRLMRLVLENSEHQEVTLKDDLQALELYMQLESLRLKHPFTYQIKIDETINAENSTIPPLLLQPFVENAIWHGLQYKPESGHISVNIHKKNGTLVCSIEDNGIGRDMSKSQKQSLVMKKESLGIKLTEERLRILNEFRNAKAYFRITDLFNSENKPAGTRIELSFPTEA